MKIEYEIGDTVCFYHKEDGSLQIAKITGLRKLGVVLDGGDGATQYKGYGQIAPVAWQLDQATIINKLPKVAVP
jgi:hypothetical protein